MCVDLGGRRIIKKKKLIFFFFFFFFFLFFFVFFFFKQKTAYEIHSGDWSSDVCSSDLNRSDGTGPGALKAGNGSPGVGHRAD